MSRRLFCQISPVTYVLSTWKERLKRYLKWLTARDRYAQTSDDVLPFVVYDHASLIRRTLGQVDMRLQENKAVNLSIAVPKVNGVVIRPGETFSFWRLVGRTARAKGYKEGLTIAAGRTCKGIGGGMCQFTNLLHWMALHSPLDIVEHHHHDRYDLFPDCGRQIPFGMGTSIVYNYLDYQLRNNTDTSFQFLVHTSDTHLCGELRADKPLPVAYHIREEDMHFVRTGDTLYRRNQVYRQVVDKKSGRVLDSRMVKQNHARVMYDPAHIDPALIREEAVAQTGAPVPEG